MDNKQKLKEWRDSPISFIRDIWGLVPQPLECEENHEHSVKCFGEFIKGRHFTWQQWLILKAVEAAIQNKAHRRISVATGRGIGKSACLAWLLHWFLFTRRDSQIGCTAPSFPTLFDVLWKELEVWHKRMPIELQGIFEWQSAYYRVTESPHKWYARARTGKKENPEALAGLHADHVALFADEASAVPDEIYRATEGSLTSKDFLFIMIGNPTRLEGFFYDTHHDDKKNWQTFQFSSLDSSLVEPGFDERIKAKYGCFVAGTKVLTSKGEKNIEDIKVGELVITPFGKRKVLESGVSGLSNKIYDVDFSNGRSFSVTGNHKIYTQRGFVHIDALEYNDKVEFITLFNLLKWNTKKILSITAENLGFRESITSSLLGKRVFQTLFTALYGKNALEQFRFIATFIIKTAILSTMILKIWSVYWLSIIFQNTLRKSGKNIRRFIRRILESVGRRLSCGINLWQEENGIENTEKEVGGTEISFLQNVLYAIKSLVVLTNQESVFAQKFAFNSTEGSWEKITKQENVLFAKSNLSLIDIVQQKPVRIVAGINHEVPVYNLTVEKDHVYYANGVLVSNSDSDEYAVDVLGQFPRAEGMIDGWMPMFSEEDIKNQIPDIGNFVKPTYMGVDPSGMGKNYSVWVGRDAFRCKVLATEAKSTDVSIAEKTITLSTHYEIKPENVKLDNFGIGANVSAEIALGVHERIHAVNVGAPPREGRFLNIRAEMYWCFREWLKKGGQLVRNPAWRQLLNIRYKRTLGGKIQVMSKEDMVRKGWDSPDEADAAALSFVYSDVGHEAIALGSIYNYQRELSNEEIAKAVNIYG